MREFDVVVYGASGFTGRLIAEHLLTHYGAAGDVRWAMAGRSAAKLAEVRAGIEAPDTLPLIVADAAMLDDEAADPLAVMAMQGLLARIFGDGVPEGNAPD